MLEKTKFQSKPDRNQINESSEKDFETTKSNVHDTSHNLNNSSHDFAGSIGSSRLKVNSMQDSFLNNCRHDHTIVEIFLTGNIIDTGVVVGFDVNTLIMENDDKSQYLIMKSAIIKIIPKKRVNYIFNDNYKCSNYIADYSGIENVGG